LNTAPGRMPGNYWKEDYDMTNCMSCEDVESITQFIDEHAGDDRVLAEIIERIHVLTDGQFRESGTLPMHIAADLILGVHQTKDCTLWNALERRNSTCDEPGCLTMFTEVIFDEYGGATTLCDEHYAKYVQRKDALT
jgi:hypothetical protein